MVQIDTSMILCLHSRLFLVICLVWTKVQYVYFLMIEIFNSSMKNLCLSVTFVDGSTNHFLLFCIVQNHLFVTSINSVAQWIQRLMVQVPLEFNFLIFWKKCKLKCFQICKFELSIFGYRSKTLTFSLEVFHHTVPSDSHQRFFFELQKVHWRMWIF